MRKKLRPYQAKAVSALTQFWYSKKKSGLVICPPGAGKTFIATSFFTTLIDKPNVIWLAHNTILLRQAVHAFEEQTDDEYGVYTGAWKKKSDKADVLFLSVFTRNLKEALEHAKFSKAKLLIIIDEAHHEAMDSYANVLRFITTNHPVGKKPMKKVGLTATPFRLDNKELKFSEVIYEITMKRLIDDGFLTPSKYYKVETKIKSRLESGSTDYTLKSLKTLHKNDRAALIAKYYDKKRHGRTLLYLPSIDACNLQIATFNKLRPEVKTAAITQETPETKRVQHIKEFREGKLDVICNVAVFSEGVDLPETQTIFLGRPTMSKALMTQMIGRGARLAPDKSHFNIVDFVDQDVPYYEYLTALWRRELFGDELPDAIALQEKRKKKLEALKNLKIKKSRLRWLYTEENLLYLYKIITIQTRRGVRLLAVSNINYKPVLSAIKMITEDNDYQTINKSFSYFGYLTSGFYQWMSFAWAIRRQAFEMIHVEDPPVFDYEAFLKVQKQYSEEVEKRIKDAIDNGILEWHPMQLAIGTTKFRYNLSGRILKLDAPTGYMGTAWASKLLSNKIEDKVAVIMDPALRYGTNYIPKEQKAIFEPWSEEDEDELHWSL